MMKTAVPLFAAIWLMLVVSVPAQDSGAALLERREAEERAKIINAAIQDIADNQRVLMKRQERLDQRIQEISERLDKLSSDVSQTKMSSASRDELRKLAESVSELEKRRQSDNERVVKSLNDLAKVPVMPAADPKPSKPEVSAPTSDKYYTYKVKPGQKLSDIVKAYNEHFDETGQEHITISDVQRENPNMNPNRIRSGQELHIPIPPKK